jgi:disulfide bond formation protein DsbB
VILNPAPRPSLALAAAAGSALLLAGALVSQYGFGLWPCPLCLWQRWPHGVAIALGLIAAALAWGGRGVPLVLVLAGAAAAATTAGIGVFHAGVELGWWAGLEACSAGPGIGGLDVATLLDPTADVPAAPRCDTVAFSFLGLSMAGWNAALSAALALMWLTALRRAGRAT